MRTRPALAPVGLLCACGLLLTSGTRADGPGQVERTLDIHVDATSGTHLEVELIAAGLEVGEQFWVKRVVDEDQYDFEDVRIETPQGRVLPLELVNKRYKVAESPSEVLHVTYRVTPGGRARHGHQGLVTSEWAGFDGRSVLQPREIAAFGDVRWHFEMPEGWTVATSMLAIDEDSFAMPPMEPRYRASVLKSLCVGLGPFREDTRKLGSTEVRVFTLDRWEDGPELSDKAHAVFQFFHDELGFEPPEPFALVWTPPGPKMAPVWSGAGATSACYERPQDGFHNWELLGHRIAHPMNEYAPHGYAITSARDHWFMEGWATYIERPALTAAGVADGTRWNALLERHYTEIDNHPAWREYPLAEEPQARGDIVENLHYRRGALVSAMLDFHLKQRTGKSLNQFVKHLGQTHGGFRKGLDLRAELASWSGAPMDDFWSAAVDQPGPVIPVWPDYVKSLPAARPKPALQAGGVRWSAEQLVEMMQTGRYAGPDDLAEALRETGRKHDELARRKIAVLPQELEELKLAFPGRTRADVDELERIWPLEGGPPLLSGGCNGTPEPLALPSLKALSSDGEAFLAWVRAEKEANHAPGGHEGVVRMRLGQDDFEPELPNSAGAVTADQKLRVVMEWVAPRIGMRLEVWKGEERIARRWVETQSDWTRTWMRFGPDRLGDHTGLLDVRLVQDGKVIANRPAWRLPAKKGADPPE